MSSIRELFGDPLLDEGSDAPFNPANLNEALDAVIASRPKAGVPEGYEPPPVTEPPAADDAAVVDPGAGGEGSVVPPPPAPLPPSPALPDPGLAPPPPLTDPFASLNDLERQELLAVRQAMLDPDRALAVKRAYLGLPDAPVAVAPPAAPAPKPTLPEDVDPDSFEAKLWQQNQDLQERLDSLTAATTQQNQQTEQERALTAAKNATVAFAQRYGDKLSPEEIQAICSHAGAQRLPEAFLPTTGGNLEDAMGKSLEFVLRSNDTLLGKVLGAPPAPPTPVHPGDSPVAQGRKRALTALSSAAAPAGTEVVNRKVIEHREDGRLTEGSRQSLIAQLMAGMNAEAEGT